jgi:chromatin remodeling complex protein RSC6
MPSSKSTNAKKSAKTNKKVMMPPTNTVAAPTPSAPTKVVAATDTPVEAPLTVVETKIASLKEQLAATQQALRNIVKALDGVKTEYNKERRQWARKNASKKSNSAKVQQPSGFRKPGFISDQLCNFLGVGAGTEMARTDVTRYLTKYIQEHQLQDKENKRIIKPDTKLKTLLQSTETDVITYFNLQSFMKRHYADPKKKVAPSATA